MNWLKNKFDNLFAIIFGLAGGLYAGQFPQYLAQYLQRLGGHIDEARRNAEVFNINELYERSFELEEGLQAIENSSVLGKIFSFINFADWNIALECYKDFVPGITFNTEGLIYIVVGTLIGFLIYELLKGIMLLISRLFSKNSMR